ncbi:MAG: hypothetical protein WD577_10000 [Bacteroidales bacterium]
MMRSSGSMKGDKGGRNDRIYRNAMLVIGIITALLFLLSLVAMIEFPGAFRFIAAGMVGMAVVFLLLRTVYHYRSTFRPKEKK